MSKRATEVLSELQHMVDPVRAAKLQRFFKTGKGEYGEGDVFLGIRVPVLRALAKKHKGVSAEESLEILHSEFHEARLLALFLLINAYDRADLELRDQIYRDYLANVAFINNWDLVDCSAMQIVGRHLFDKNRGQLRKLARSKDLWERRIAMIATFYFIRRYEFQDTLVLAAILLDDKEDLLHKAVGWMLREVGNKSRSVEEDFLIKHYHKMPRTMLRYAIEKFPELRRQAYLKGEL